MSMQPGTGTFANTAVPVTISWFDESPTYIAWTKWNGVEVGSSFEVITWLQPWTWPDADGESYRENGRSTGMVHIASGQPNTLEVRICDQAAMGNPGGRCTTVTQTYSLAAAPGVEVTPKSVFSNVQVSGSNATTTFTVKNTGGAAAAYTLTPQCRDAHDGQPLATCSLSTTSVSLGASATQNVTLTYSRSTSDRVLLLQVRATQNGVSGVEDAGWRDVSVREQLENSEGAATAAVVDLNSTTEIDRSQCVTVAIGPGAAYECGELRLAVGLPVHRTRGRTWAPTLLYSNQHASPRPTIHVDVTLPSNVSKPDTVQVVVTINGETHHRYFRGSDWVPGMTRRVGITVDGQSYTTGVYPYQLQVITKYPRATYGSAVLNREIAVVNRTHDPFGGGWWWSGLETLCLSNCGLSGSRLFWIGGDGSTRVFEPVQGSSTEWRAARLDGPPDTLKLSYPGGVAQYARVLRGGGQVHFNAYGQHVRTVNRLGQTTEFDHSVSPNRLIAVRPPGDGSGNPRWELLYNGAGRLSTVNAITGTSSRAVSLAYGYGGDRRVTGFTLPDQKSITFTYGGPISAMWIINRYAQDTSRVQFNYAETGKLASARTFPWASATADDPITRFIAAEGQGAALSSTTTYVSAARHAVYTRIDGPRSDVVDHIYIWPGIRGAPVRIRDATGAETIVMRDATWPLLARRVIAPNGLVRRAGYDAMAEPVNPNETVGGCYY
jgi:hypothetical protein